MDRVHDLLTEHLDEIIQLFADQCQGKGEWGYCWVPKGKTGR